MILVKEALNTEHWLVVLLQAETRMPVEECMRCLVYQCATVVVALFHWNENPGL